MKRRTKFIAVTLVVVLALLIGVLITRPAVLRTFTEDHGHAGPASYAQVSGVHGLRLVEYRMSVAPDGQLLVEGQIELDGDCRQLTVELMLIAPVSGSQLADAEGPVGGDHRFAVTMAAEDSIRDRVTVGALTTALLYRCEGVEIARFQRSSVEKWKLTVERRRPYPLRDKTGMMVKGKLVTDLNIEDFELIRWIRDPQNPDPAAHLQSAEVHIDPGGHFESRIGGGTKFVELYTRRVNTISLELRYRGETIERVTYPH